MASMKVVSRSLFLMFRQMDGCSSRYFTTSKQRIFVLEVLDIRTCEERTQLKCSPIFGNDILQTAVLLKFMLDLKGFKDNRAYGPFSCETDKRLLSTCCIWLREKKS
jgi:hypothetical protein